MSRNLPAIRLPMPQAAAAEGIDHRKWAVLVEAIYPNARTPEAIMLAWAYCKARGLDPFRRPVNIVSMYNSTLGRNVETVWEGINGIEANAAKTGQWAGMDPPRWGPDVTEVFSGSIERKDWDSGRKTTRQVEVTVTYPEWCEITIYRKVDGERCAFTEIVYWREAYATLKGTDVPNEMWAKRPRGQLHKCAKAAVLRAAFPEVAGYAAEEMEGRDIKAGGAVIDTTAQVVDAVEPEIEPVEVDLPPAPKPSKPAAIALLTADGEVAGEYASYGEWLAGCEMLAKENAKVIDANYQTLTVIATSKKAPAELKLRAEALRERADIARQD